MRGDGVISEEVYENLSAEVDAALEGSGGPFWFVPQESLPHRLKDGLSGNAEVEDIEIESGSICNGMQVKDVTWPHHFVIASLRRGTQVLIPSGDTILCECDVLTAVGEAAALREARRLCQKGHQAAEVPK